jgi:AcrR family transcriptional regulator
VANDTKQRLIDATSDLFKVHGYTGTGVKQIVDAASAPFASLYHFFPGGKEELGAETIRHSGALYGLLWLEIVHPARDIATGVRRFFDGAAQTLMETDYADACPIATVALEVASTSETLREATADVFNLWLDGATDDFVAAGIPRKRARALAIQFVARLEGAFLLSRSLRSIEPMKVTGKLAEQEVRSALAARAG